MASPETIYRSLFIQARGVLKKKLMAHLRTRRSMRRARAGHPSGDYAWKAEPQSLRAKDDQCLLDLLK